MRVVQFTFVSIIALLTLSVLRAEAQSRDLRPCLAISDVDERVECLEGRAPPAPPPEFRRGEIPRQSQPPNPSFDCRVARSSAERAICGDRELAELDNRMGQAFQQALSVQNNPQALRESQRRWIAQRDRACGAARELRFDCLLNITKQRATELSQLTTNSSSSDQSRTLNAVPAPLNLGPASQTPASPSFELEKGSPQPTSGPPPVSAAPPLASDSKAVVQQTPRPPTSDSGKSPESEQTQGAIAVFALFGIGLAILAAIVKRRRYARRKQDLIARFGVIVAEGILAGKVWQGMSNEQLLESWGNPADIDREVRRTKTKETWKYNQTGKNRFANRVFLENDIVIGWKV